jgi:membrane protease YdiL (CAAX protease family)
MGLMEQWIQIIARHKEFFGTSTVAVGSLVILWMLGGDSRVSPMLQSIIAAVGVFLVMPLVYCKLLLGRPLSALGFQKGNPWAGIGGGVLALITALAALFALWNFTPLLRDYQLPVIVEEQFLFFVLYEVILGGFITLLFEVFFRGFVMLLWLRKWGVWSVVVQAVLFSFLVYVSGGLNASMIPALVFAPFAGLIAYQSQSLWYSYSASWFFFFLTDAIVLILR